MRRVCVTVCVTARVYVHHHVFYSIVLPVRCSVRVSRCVTQRKRNIKSTSLGSRTVTKVSPFAAHCTLHTTLHCANTLTPSCRRRGLWQSGSQQHNQPSYRAADISRQCWSPSVWPNKPPRIYDHTSGTVSRASADVDHTVIWQLV